MRSSHRCLRSASTARCSSTSSCSRSCVAAARCATSDGAASSGGGFLSLRSRRTLRCVGADYLQTFNQSLFPERQQRPVPRGAARLQPLLRAGDHRRLCHRANLGGDHLPGLHLWVAAPLGAGRVRRYRSVRRSSRPCTSNWCCSCHCSSSDVVLASLYQGSRSIVPGILTHALFNLPNIIAILSTTTTC